MDTSAQQDRQAISFDCFDEALDPFARQFGPFEPGCDPHYADLPCYVSLEGDDFDPFVDERADGRGCD